MTAEGTNARSGLRVGRGTTTTSISMAWTPAVFRNSLKSPKYVYRSPRMPSPNTVSTAPSTTRNMAPKPAGRSTWSPNRVPTTFMERASVISTFFEPTGNPAIPPFRLGQYGMTVGGPIVKDHTFSFLSYEGLRQLQATTTQAVVPSASLQQAILATSPQMCSILQAYPWRPSTGTIGNCTPRFVFPDGSFSSVASDSDQFTTASPTTVHEDTWLVRIDHKFSETTTLYGHAQRDISLVSAPNGSSVALDRIRTINHPANYLLALQHTFGPHLFNEAKVYV